MSLAWKDPKAWKDPNKPEEATRQTRTEKKKQKKKNKNKHWIRREQENPTNASPSLRRPRDRADTRVAVAPERLPVRKTPAKQSTVTPPHEVEAKGDELQEKTQQPPNTQPNDAPNCTAEPNSTHQQNQITTSITTRDLQ